MNASCDGSAVRGALCAKAALAVQSDGFWSSEHPLPAIMMLVSKRNAAFSSTFRGGQSQAACHRCRGGRGRPARAVLPHAPSLITAPHHQRWRRLAENAAWLSRVASGAAVPPKSTCSQHTALQGSAPKLTDRAAGQAGVQTRPGARTAWRPGHQQHACVQMQRKKRHAQCSGCAAWEREGYCCEASCKSQPLAFACAHSSGSSSGSACAAQCGMRAAVPPRLPLPL